MNFYHEGISFQEHKRQIIIECLIKNNGNRTHTAKALKMSYRGINDFLKRHPDINEKYPSPHGQKMRAYKLLSHVNNCTVEMTNE